MLVHGKLLLDAGPCLCGHAVAQRGSSSRVLTAAARSRENQIGMARLDVGRADALRAQRAGRFRRASTTPITPPPKRRLASHTPSLAGLMIPKGSYTDGQTKIAACVYSEMTRSFRQHLLDPDDKVVRTVRPRALHGGGHLTAPISGVSGAPAQRTTWTPGGEVAGSRGPGGRCLSVG